MKKTSIIVLCVIIALQLLNLSTLIKRKKNIPLTPQYKVILEICKDEYIAGVLANSKYPYLVTAIAKIESDFKPQIKGDNGKAIGMYQIQPQHWGRVPDSLKGQTRKCETILEALHSEHGTKSFIQRYNGSGKSARRYQQRILQLVSEMERREKEYGTYKT